MLCQTCGLMLRGQVGRQWKGTYDLYFLHHRNIGSLLQSAESECTVCLVLLEELAAAARLIIARQQSDKTTAASITGLKPELPEKSLAEASGGIDDIKHTLNNAAAILNARQQSDKTTAASITGLKPELSDKSLAEASGGIDDTKHPLSNASLSVLNEPDEDSKEEMYRLDFKLQWYSVMRKRTFVLKQIDSPFAPFRTPILNDTSSGEVFKLALTWIKACKCVEDLGLQQDGLNPPMWRPTRLIDLSDLKSEAYGDIYKNKFQTNKIGNKTGGTNLFQSKKKKPDELEVKLVDTKELQNNKSYYVTLSHKWGNYKGKKQLKLMTENLEEFKRGLKLQDLPTTFRDAVEFAAKLHNVQYIWIDSLCIIQNSDEDWLAESSQMRLVYSRSYLNISATAAEHSDQGLYSKRNPRSLWEAEANVNIEGLPGSRTEKSRVNGMPLPLYDAETQQDWSTYDLGSRQLKMRTQLHTYIRRCTIIDASYFDNLVNQASVNRRGWVLQERLLAPRVLHFCKGQIAWECSERSAAEGLPWGLSNFQRRRDDTIFKEIPLKGLTPLTHGKSLRENRLQGTPEPDFHLKETEEGKERLYALEIWNRIVEAYSKTELTFPKDKLPALSGIANKMSEYIRCDYIAGLWNWNLPSQLLWRVQPEFRHASKGSQFIHHGKRPSIYRAPSFSWASLDARGESITCGEVTDQDILVKLESAEVVQSAEQRKDQWGQVSGGHIILWGSIFKLRLYKKVSGHHAWKFDRGDPSRQETPVPLDLTREEHMNVYLDCPTDDDTKHQIFNSDDVCCLPVARGERMDSEEGKYVICLLLQREICTPRIHGFGTFRRIGLTKLSTWADKAAHEHVLNCARSSSDNGSTQAGGSEGRQQLLYLV